MGDRQRLRSWLARATPLALRSRGVLPRRLPCLHRPARCGQIASADRRAHGAGRESPAPSASTRASEAEVQALFARIENEIGADRGLPLQRRLQRQQAADRDHSKSCSSRPGSWPAMRGFLVGREAARVMVRAAAALSCSPARPQACAAARVLPRFPSAKFGLRGVAQAMARELGPKNIHVAHLIIDAAVDSEAIHQRMKAASGIEAEDIPPDSLTKTALDRGGLLVRAPAEPGTAGPTSSICGPPREMVR